MGSLRAGLIPDDENGQVLKQMLEEGDDLDAPRGIDFYHVFADEAAAQAFADAAAALPDLAVSAPEVDEDDVWEVVSTRVMAPKHSAIGALEAQLDKLAGSFSGYSDGWGCPPAGIDAD